ncbi:uncharacterized protein [Diabrotica undecimpunctata]|uniref:uncharacterized protein n=1 Tax=Diabrotica undecimpunctata TaxID=50387 RepID=UPI003B63E790
MDDEKLILLVQTYECLFNLGHKDYSDSNIKGKIWKTIGEELGVAANDCKQRWFSLRDQFRRALRSKKTVSGQAAVKKRKWKYEDELNFLIPFFQERDTVSNVVSENSSDELAGVEESSCRVENEGESSREQETYSQLETGESSQSSSQSENRSQKFKNPPVQKPKRAKVCNSETAESPSTTLMKYIISKTEQPTNTNPIDAFLSGISETIKTFPPVYQHMAKTKIFGIVSEIELQLLAPISGQQQPSAYDPYRQPSNQSHNNYVNMGVPSAPLLQQQQFPGIISHSMSSPTTDSSQSSCASVYPAIVE